MRKDVHKRYGTSDLDGHWKLPLLKSYSVPIYSLAITSGQLTFLPFINTLVPKAPIVPQHDISSWQIMGPFILTPSQQHLLSVQLLCCCENQQGNLEKEEFIWGVQSKRDRSPSLSRHGAWKKAGVVLGSSRELTSQSTNSKQRESPVTCLPPTRPRSSSFPNNQTRHQVFKCPRLQGKHLIRTTILYLPSVCSQHPKLPIQDLAYLAQNKPPNNCRKHLTCSITQLQCRIATFATSALVPKPHASIFAIALKNLITFLSLLLVSTTAMVIPPYPPE